MDVLGVGIMLTTPRANVTSMTITMPSPVWTPQDEDLDDDDVEFEDPPAVPVTHPVEE